MSKIDDGGAAFPHHETTSTGEPFHDHLGMTLRDYFAAAAIQGCSSYILERSVKSAAVMGLMSHYAFAMADAMLAARKEGNQP